MALLPELNSKRFHCFAISRIKGWRDGFVPRFDLVVFLFVPTEIRLERLREREARHFGEDVVSPGGWRHEETEEFIEWASHYDDGSREGRGLPRHEAWLKMLTCPILRIHGTRPTSDLVRDAVRALEEPI